MTMSLHKLTAGSGYDYLTRQVAALDATEKGHTGLASYYTERGESPGVWIGSGMDGIDGLTVGDPVTAEQMRALFGCGLHPFASSDSSSWKDRISPHADFQEGPPGWALHSGSTLAMSGPFRVEVAKRIAALSSRPRGRPRLGPPGGSGPGADARWHGSSSAPSMVASRSMRGSWPAHRERLPAAYADGGRI